MKITRHQINRIIERAVAATDPVEDIEDDIMSVLDNIILDLEQKAESQKTDKIDEAGVVLVAGAALALPVIMKGIGKIGALASRVLPDDNESGEAWEQWWSQKSDELHHLYMVPCEKIVDAAVKIAVFASGGKYQDPGPEAKKKAAKVVFMTIIAIMAAMSGIGAVQALAHKSWAVAGAEGVLGTVKVGEIQALASELIIDILGMSSVA